MMSIKQTKKIMVIPQNRHVVVRKEITNMVVAGIALTAPPRTCDAEVISSDHPLIDVGMRVVINTSAGKDIGDELTVVNGDSDIHAIWT